MLILYSQHKQNMSYPSISKNKLALYSSLANSKMRKRHSLFIAEGRKCVADTLSHFHCRNLIVTSEGLDFAVEHGANVDVLEVTAKEMKSLSSLSTPSDVLAVYEIPAEPECHIDEDSLYLVLDGVRDPGNLGTIIRTAHWFGIHTILASRDSVDIYNPKTIQSSMGSVAGVRFIYTDLVDLFSKFSDMPVYGLLLDGANIYHADLGKSGFIVMGNEGKGISPELRKLVDHPLLIPPSDPEHGESLNVAIATAVTLALFRNSEAN